MCSPSSQYVPKVLPLTQAKNGDKQFWKDKFHAANECFLLFFGFMGGFLVAWVFRSFHLYLFLVEDFVENHVLKKTSTREEGKKKLKKDKKLLEVSTIISARCFYISTKMLAIMEKFIKNRRVLGLYFGEKRESFKTSLVDGV
jgi:hypothetical protein